MLRIARHAVWNHALRRRETLRILLTALGMMWGTAASTFAAEIAPGVTYTEYSLPGPNKVYVVAVDLARSEYKLEVGWNGRHRNFGSCEPGCINCTGKLATSAIAAQYDNPAGNHDVLAATNGSYFGCPPDIVGWPIASNGDIVQPPYNMGHPTLAQVQTLSFGPSRVPAIEASVTSVAGGAAGVLTFASGTTMVIDQYNLPQEIGKLTAYTPGYDTSTRSANQGVEVILANVTYPMRSDREVSGIVTAVRTGVASTNNTIPVGGMVLNAWGSPAAGLLFNNARVGDRLRMLFRTTSQGMNNADFAITGSGWILHNGIANPNGNWSSTLSGTNPFSVNPRTVMAWNPGKFFMVVCDGRGCGGAVGFTFQDMANFLTGTPEIAALDAINFDGGGSSTLVVDGVLRNLPSDSCGAAQRPVANAILLVRETPTPSFPFSDLFAAGGRLAGWDDKFAYNDVVVFTPSAPRGDGRVLKVIDASGTSTARRGDYADADYAVQADIYCDYRPDVAADGYERYALFARDSGTGALGLSTYGGGNCYALCFDSHTGLIHAGRYAGGTFTDLGTPVIQATSSGWHRFRIECSGSNITYRINNARVLTVSDATHARGYFGIGYQSFFATASNRRGTRADHFSATVAAPAQPADLDFDADVDMSDFALFQRCLSGSEPQTLLACHGADLDSDGAVDDADLDLFAGCIRGAKLPADPGCAP